MSDVDYIREVIGDRDAIEWFTDAREGEDTIAGPADVWLVTEDGSVTWGWTIAPIPVEVAGRRFRRFRHPDGWAVLVDADEPEQVHADTPLTLHTAGDVAVTVPTGSPPGAGDAYTLAKASSQTAGYDIRPGWTTDRVSEVLALWIEAYLGETVDVRHRAATQGEAAEMARLAGEVEEPQLDEGPMGFDDELADLVGGVDDVFWFQGDLTWPDLDEAEAFRDRVDVRMRHAEGGDSWLASIEPIDDRGGSARRLPDGGLVVLDPDDPTSIRLEWDRRIIAISRQTTGFEPAGNAAPLDRAPSTEQWEELRRVLSEHDDCMLIEAPAWSEGRVAAALSEWASAWTGADVRFVYDFDDPVVQAAIAANDALAEAEPPPPSIRTGTVQRCAHTDEPISPLEEPIPCGARATAYYSEGDAMVMVCNEHTPAGVKTTTLLRA